jgi:bacillithiol biosynthesis deacetylase BshB1
MKLDLLAIAPHPDDAELTCGGTLLKMAELGYRTGVLDLTRGEMGTRGTPEQRQREAAKASRILRLSYRENLGVPDTAVSPNREHALALAAVIRKLKPRVVILPYWDGRHPDHYNGAKLGYEGVFLAGFRKLDLPGEAYRPHKILYAAAYDRSVRPTFVVDISRQFERRRRAIECYASQFRPLRKEKGLKVYIPLDQLENEMALIARWYGQMAGVHYAEPFVVKEVMQVEDVVDLPVRSV